MSSIGQFLHRNADGVLFRRAECFLVTGVDMSGDADPGIVGQNAFESQRSTVGTVGDNDLTGVQTCLLYTSDAADE